MRFWVILLRFPLVFSGIAGYFVCFWPGDRPIRRAGLVVFLPALLSLAGIIYRFFLASSPSVLHFQGNGKSFLHWLLSNFLKLPTGLLVCAAGLALMMVFFCGLLLACRHFAASYKVAISRGAIRKHGNGFAPWLLCWSGRVS